MNSEASEARYAKYNEKLRELNEILKKNKRDLSDDEIDRVVNTTFDMLKELANMHDKSGKIRTDSKFTKEEQLEIARNFLNSVKKSIEGINNNYEIIQNAYKYVLKENPFNIYTDDDRGDIFAQISNQILLASAFNNKNLKPSLSSSIETRNTRHGEKAAINKYYQLLEKEEAKNKQNQSEQKIGQLESDVKEKGDIIERGKKIVDDLQGQNKNLKGKLTDAQILRNEVDEVKADIKQLLEKNKSDILNDKALRLAGDPDLKKNIRKIKGDLKAANPYYSDGDINYIISKALSENERYMKTVAANPDLFERDMSNDTIQKENEQFQSKLRQQNLRYILPKFIERRDKLVENTLNPNLLKGAFAV